LPRTEPGFVVGFAKRIALANPDLTQFTTVHDIEPDMPQTRVNDAAVDPLGGIVFGTIDEQDWQPVASLYRLGPDHRLERLLGDVTVSNGLAFSPDGSVMYFADSPTGMVRRFGIDGGFAHLEELEPLAGPTIAPGMPDGATVDLEGHYWSARVGGGCLVRISPDGHVSNRVDLAVPAPTCVALGGKSGTTLFATTMRLGQSKKELRKNPQAGGLFATEVNVAGDPQRLSLL
jgi:L-arabinonolactonase